MPVQSFENFKKSRFMSMSRNILRIVLTATGQTTFFVLMQSFLLLNDTLKELFHSAPLTSLKKGQYLKVLFLSLSSMLAAWSLTTEIGRLIAFAASFVVLSDLALPGVHLFLTLLSRIKGWSDYTKGRKELKDLKAFRALIDEKDPEAHYKKELVDTKIKRLQSKNIRLFIQHSFNTFMTVLKITLFVGSFFFPVLAPVLPALLIVESVLKLAYKIVMAPDKSAFQKAQEVSLLLTPLLSKKAFKNLPSLKELRFEAPLDTQAYGTTKKGTPLTVQQDLHAHTSTVSFDLDKGAASLADIKEFIADVCRETTPELTYVSLSLPIPGTPHREELLCTLYQHCLTAGLKPEHISFDKEAMHISDTEIAAILTKAAPISIAKHPQLLFKSPQTFEQRTQTPPALSPTQKPISSPPKP